MLNLQKPAKQLRKFGENVIINIKYFYIYKSQPYTTQFQEYLYINTKIKTKNQQTKINSKNSV